MTSSAERRPNYSRRFFWLAMAILVVIAGYTAGWFYFADRVLGQVNSSVGAMNGNGRRASCERAEMRGYPFRMGVFCDSVLFEDAAGGVGFRAGALRSAAQVYRPWQMIAELDGPATLQVPGLNALDLEWSSLRASLRIPMLPERFSLEGKDLVISLDQQGPDRTALARAASAEFHAQWMGDDMDFAVRFGELQLDPSLTNDAVLPPLSGLVDLRVDDGAWFPNSDLGPLRGKSGTLRTVTLSIDDETGATLTGPFSVDENGVVDARFEVTLRNPRALATVLGDLMPENRRAIELSLRGLAAGGGSPTLPLTIEQGRVRLGFLPLGTLPPL